MLKSDGYIPLTVYVLYVTNAFTNNAILEPMKWSIITLPARCYLILLYVTKSNASSASGEVESVWQNNGRHQCPRIDTVANPCAHNFHPTCPICPSYWREILEAAVLGGLVDVHSQQSRYPGCSKEENDVEESVAVLCRCSLVVLDSISCVTLVVVI